MESKLFVFEFPKKYINGIYTVSAALPILAIAVCHILNFQENKTPNKTIPSISDILVNYPENKIFSVSMSIECIFLAVAFAIRNILTARNLKQNSGDTNNPFYMNIVAIIAVGSLFTFSMISQKESYYLHFSSLYIFFISMMIYNILADQTGKTLKWKITDLSEFISYLMASLFLGYYLSYFLINGPENLLIFFDETAQASQRGTKIHNFMTIFLQYALFISVFYKVFNMQFELPQFILVNDKKYLKREYHND